MILKESFAPGGSPAASQKAWPHVAVERLHSVWWPAGPWATNGAPTAVFRITDTLEDRVTAFAQLIKVYGQSPEGERKYSPAEVLDTEVVPGFGNCDPTGICTSIVERENLTIRMQMRRLTRLTNAFSKKRENLWAAYCLHFAYDNFCRTHRSLRITPAMAAGITTGPWEITDLLKG